MKLREEKEKGEPGVIATGGQGKAERLTPLFAFVVTRRWLSHQVTQHTTERGPEAQIGERTEAAFTLVHSLRPG